MAVQSSCMTETLSVDNARAHSIRLSFRSASDTTLSVSRFLHESATTLFDTREDLISHLLTANPPVKCWELTPELAFPTSVLTFREPPFVMGRSDPVRRFLVDVRDIDLAVHIYGKLLHRRRVPGRPWCGPVRVIVDADRTSRGCLVQRQALRVVLRYHIAPLLHDIIGELVLSKPLQSKPLHGPKSVFHKTNSELAKMRQNALIVGLPCFISTFESFQNFVRDLINFNAGGDWPQTRTVSFELEVHHFLRLWASIYTLFRTHGNVLTHNVLLHFHIVLKDILGMLYFHLGFMLTRQRLPRTFANHTRRTRKALIAAGSDYLYFVVHQNLLREKNCSPIYTYIMYLLAVADAKSNDLPFEAYSSSNCTAAFMAACQPLPTNVNPATHTAQTILVALADAQEPYESPFPENTYVWWAGAWSRRLATVGPDYAIMGAIGAAWHRYIGVGNGNMIDEKDRWTRPLERWAMDSAWRAEFYEGLGDIVAEMLRETFGQRPEQMDVFRNLQWM